MSGVLKFEDFSSTERRAIANQRQNTAMIAPKWVLRMTDFSIFAQSRLMPGYVEARPSDRALDKKTAVISFLNAPAGLQRAWQRLCINTYRNGGRIFCREIDNENVEAVFRF